MPPGFDEKDLARYPFLQEAQAKIAGSELNRLESFLANEAGRRIIDRAAERIEAAITIPSQGLAEHFREFHARIPNALESLYTYGMARIIASCINDRTVIDRLIAYEARRSAFYLMSDEYGETEESKREEVGRRLGLELRDGTVPLAPYIEMISGLRDYLDGRELTLDQLIGRAVPNVTDLVVSARSAASSALPINFCSAELASPAVDG